MLKAILNLVENIYIEVVRSQASSRQFWNVRMNVL